MMIALSVLAAWIIMSILFSFLWGAVIRRGMEGSRKAGRPYADFSSTDDTGSHWSAPIKAVTSDGTEPAKQTGSRMRKSSQKEVRAGTLSGYIPWAQCRSSWSRTFVDMESMSASERKWGTSGSFWPERMFLPNSHFVLSTSADN